MPFGHPGLPLRATAWVRAGRDDRMAVLIEQQDGRCGRWFRRGTIRRLEVDIPRTRVTVVDVSASLLLGQQILQTQVVGHCAHALVPRRLRARASARSRTSL